MTRRLGWACALATTLSFTGCFSAYEPQPGTPDEVVAENIARSEQAKQERLSK